MDAVLRNGTDVARSTGDGPAQAARDVASAMLFREILKPLALGIGPVGETAVDAVADALFLRPRDERRRA